MFNKLFPRHRRRSFRWPATSQTEIAALLKRLHPTVPPSGLFRMGAIGDGGYLVPDCLDGCEACYSPGVCDVSKFEKDCSSRGMRVYLADASVDRPAETDDHFFFTKKFIGAVDSSEFMTMDTWVQQTMGESGNNMLLQMDIEGFEYESILSMSNQLLQRFRIIVIEFHDMHQMWNKLAFESAIRPTFQKLLANHLCVHSHPNNNRPIFHHAGIGIPPLIEMTFLRRDSAEGALPATQFPHPLDHDCGDLPSITLPPCWHAEQ
ncbi:FkbM family methyltransferase [Rosistilla oblonga]|uniref:FkbM family methyltransferase n=1 Tax=Rosistilla oblonga TaxID=2527990 RepID=UPI003A9873EF